MYSCPPADYSTYVCTYVQGVAFHSDMVIKENDVGKVPVVPSFIRKWELNHKLKAQLFI